MKITAHLNERTRHYESVKEMFTLAFLCPSIGGGGSKFSPPPNVPTFVNFH